jgi:hypothetical protein
MMWPGKHVATMKGEARGRLGWVGDRIKYSLVARSHEQRVDAVFAHLGTYISLIFITAGRWLTFDNLKRAGELGRGASR